MQIKTEVKPYEHKFLPLHMEIGTGNYGDHEIKQHMSVADGTPLICIDGTWYAVSMQSLIIGLIEEIEKGQSDNILDSLSPEFRSLHDRLMGDD
jgi:hypothetical protein